MFNRSSKWIASSARRVFHTLALCTIAVAQEKGTTPVSPQTDVYTVTNGNGVSAPQLISSVQPGLSREAREAGWGGTLNVAAVFGSDGLVRDIKVLNSPGLGMDEEVAAALKKWTFKPGEKEGRPVSVAGTIQWEIVGKAVQTDVYKVGNGVSAPQIISKVEPDYPKEAGAVGWEGTLRVSLVVGADGAARDFKVLNSPGLGLDEQAIAALRQWKFKPGEKDGKPVSTAVEAALNFMLSSGKRIKFVKIDDGSITTPPEILYKRIPNYPKGAKDWPDDVIVSLAIDADGRASGFKILEARTVTSGNGSLKREVVTIPDGMAEIALQAVKWWTFAPAMKDGKKVAVTGTVVVPFEEYLPE